MKCKLQKIVLIICDTDANVIRDTLRVLSKNINPSQTVVLTTEKIKLLLADDITNDNSSVQGQGYDTRGGTTRLCSTDPKLKPINVHLLPEEGKNDCILQMIREFTDQYDVELVCCVAGESELSAIAVNAMTFAARYQDRLCHATANPIKITDIPFARLCYLYQDKFNHLPKTYADTVELANLHVSRHVNAPEVFLSTDPVKCMIGDCELSLEADEFILFWLLATRCKNEIIPLQGEAELLDEFHAFIESTISTVMPEINGIRKKLLEETEADILKRIDSLTEKIKSTMTFNNGRDFLLPSRDQKVYGISFPPENIACPRNY
jgi:hypothetical protein